MCCQYLEYVLQNIKVPILKSYPVKGEVKYVFGPPTEDFRKIDRGLCLNKPAAGKKFWNPGPVFCAPEGRQNIFEVFFIFVLGPLLR